MNNTVTNFNKFRRQKKNFEWNDMDDSDNDKVGMVDQF